MADQVIDGKPRKLFCTLIATAFSMCWTAPTANSFLQSHLCARHGIRLTPEWPSHHRSEIFGNPAGSGRVPVNWRNQLPGAFLRSKNKDVLSDLWRSPGFAVSAPAVNEPGKEFLDAAQERRRPARVPSRAYGHRHDHRQREMEISARAGLAAGWRDRDQRQSGLCLFK